MQYVQRYSLKLNKAGEFYQGQANRKENGWNGGHRIAEEAKAVL